jgi:hypothetical protein
VGVNYSEHRLHAALHKAYFTRNTNVTDKVDQFRPVSSSADHRKQFSESSRMPAKNLPLDVFSRWCQYLIASVSHVT